MKSKPGKRKPVDFGSFKHDLRINACHHHHERDQNRTQNNAIQQSVTDDWPKTCLNASPNGACYSAPSSSSSSSPTTVLFSSSKSDNRFFACLVHSLLPTMIARSA